MTVLTRTRQLVLACAVLAVAVPAVMGYNWLIRRNKTAMERVRAFAGDLHNVLLARGKKVTFASSMNAIAERLAAGRLQALLTLQAHSGPQALAQGLRHRRIPQPWKLPEPQ